MTADRVAPEIGSLAYSGESPLRVDDQEARLRLMSVNFPRSARGTAPGMPAYLANSSVANTGQLDLTVRSSYRHCLTLPGCHRRLVEGPRRDQRTTRIDPGGRRGERIPDCGFGLADEARQAPGCQRSRAATFCSSRCKRETSAGFVQHRRRPSAFSRRDASGFVGFTRSFACPTASTAL